MQTSRSVQSTRQFDVWNEVPLVPQTSSMSCWAAAAAMVVGWRERRPVDPGSIAEGLGMWAAYREGLRPRDVDELARVWGLVQETRGEWTLEALHQLLEANGPVWMGEASPGLHSVVVTGMSGDGSTDGTVVRINDPWPIGVGERYGRSWGELLASCNAASAMIGVPAQVLHAGARSAGRRRSWDARVYRQVESARDEQLRRRSFTETRSLRSARVGGAAAGDTGEMEPAERSMPPRHDPFAAASRVRAPAVLPLSLEEGVSMYDDEATVSTLSLDSDVRAWLSADDTARRAFHASVASWISSTETSGIELIADDAARRRYLAEVDWGSKVFPGWRGDSGEARNLFADLATAVPERRVPRLLRYRDVEREVVEVPGQQRHRLWPEAKDKFVAMQDAARRAGVPLMILSAFRSEQRQRELAARNPNANAVAQGHSAHSYGLAIDVKLSVPGFDVEETRTRPMTNIVRMYRSPVYKWLALHAREFGFYPYRMEPWHFEYNPVGLRDRFEPKSAQTQAYGAPVGLFEAYRADPPEADAWESSTYQDSQVVVAPQQAGESEDADAYAPEPEISVATQWSDRVAQQLAFDELPEEIARGIFKRFTARPEEGNFSVTCDVAEFMHDDTPMTQPWVRKTAIVTLKATHPSSTAKDVLRGDISRSGEQLLKLQLDFEHNGYDIKNAVVRRVTQGSSKLGREKMSITFIPKNATAPKAEVARIDFVMKGKWDPGLGNKFFDFSGKMRVTARGDYGFDLDKNERVSIHFAAGATFSDNTSTKGTKPQSDVRRVSVFFAPPGSAEISNAEMTLIKKWIKGIKDEEVRYQRVLSGAIVVNVAGHASSTGQGKMNQELSKKRVNKILPLLKEELGSDAKFRLFAHGEDDPSQKDERESWYERRVDVWFDVPGTR